MVGPNLNGDEPSTITAILFALALLGFGIGLPVAIVILTF